MGSRYGPAWNSGLRRAGGADALWGRNTMTGLGAAGPGSGNRLDGELGYALPVGRRLVGTPGFGITTSEYGRDYRLGYSLSVLSALQGSAMNFEFGLDARPTPPEPAGPGKSGPQSGWPSHRALVDVEG